MINMDGNRPQSISIQNNNVDQPHSSADSFELPIPLEQALFIGCQLLGLLYGLLFRCLVESYTSSPKYFKKPPSPKAAGKQPQILIHLSALIPGVVFICVCFGSQIFHLICLTIISYILLLTTDPECVHWLTFFLAMGHLSLLHINRLFNYSQEYRLDVTAPMMILVQKIISIAFSLRDGSINRKQQLEQLNLEQKLTSIRTAPTFLEYCSYCLNFQTILCGPFMFYTDYRDYIDGTKLKKYELNRFPPVSKLIWEQLFTCTILASFILKFAPQYPPESLLKDAFYQATFVGKLWLLYLVTWVARLKYYFAWKLSECVCNASGLGFNGFEPKNPRSPKYDLATNVLIYDFEMSLSFRDALASWNISTTKWFRVIAYDRVRKHKTLTVFALSALWHGFFPGYYLTTATGGLFTVAFRIARRLLRHRFTGSVETMFLYHVLTWLSTRLAIAYLAFPFILLEFYSSFKVYCSLYFFGHLSALFVCIFLPHILDPMPTKAISGSPSSRIASHPPIHGNGDSMLNAKTDCQETAILQESL